MSTGTLQRFVDREGLSVGRARKSIPTRTRFALTYTDADGVRCIFCVRDTRQQATTQRRAVLANNSHDMLFRYAGPMYRQSLQVQPVECYHGGDPIPGSLGYFPDFDTNLTPEERERVKKSADPLMESLLIKGAYGISPYQRGALA